MANLWSKVSDLLPLIGALGGGLGAFGGIAMRVSQATSFPTLIVALRPTASEISELALAVGLLKAHFNHRNLSAQVKAQNQ